eukprot:893168_1
MSQSQYSNLHIYTVLLLLSYPALSYFVPDDATPGSWAAAKAQCEIAGSTLATVPVAIYGDPSELGSVNKACLEYCNAKLIVTADCFCWIGLRANMANDPFTYDDGTMINTNSYGFTDNNRPTVKGTAPWATDEPNQNDEANICVYIYSNDDFWYDVNCDNGGSNDIYPLCNADKTTGCQADCTKCANKDECSDSRLICAYADKAVGGTGCVPQSDTPFFGVDIGGVGFNEAELYCNYYLGAHLASIHSELENEWAVSLCESIGQPGTSCNIGLRYLHGPEWEWIDGSEFDYGMVNKKGVYPNPPWDDGKPGRCNVFNGNQKSLISDPQEQEKGRGCIGYIYNSKDPTQVAAWRDDGTDYSDDSERAFICRIPTLSPTTNPTNDPTNGPTNNPTNNPTNVPTNVPTNYPTKSPSHPSKYPTLKPTDDEEGTSSEQKQS